LSGRAFTSMFQLACRKAPNSTTASTCKLNGRCSSRHSPAMYVP
jgi:hypothetical protein